MKTILQRRCNFKRLLALTIAMFVLNVSLFAQSSSAQGRVVDEFGEAVIGATVIIDGTYKGTITDADGKFLLEGVESDAMLNFSYIGMVPQTVAASTNMNVVMVIDALVTEEVVVVGYGTQKKTLVTGANSNIKGDKIDELNPTTAMEALQGTVPGLSITRNSGAPGAGTSVTIRGMGTIGNSDPLYIVDGVSVSNIDYLNPSDIEAIDVLKDAASAAIYGSRAANGVVLVTTKKGTKSRDGSTSTSITYDGYFGIQNNYKELETLNAQEYMFIMDEARTNDGLAPFDWESLVKNNTFLSSTFGSDVADAYGNYVWGLIESGWEGTNWVDEISKDDAIIQSHAVNFMGNNQDFTYAAGISYYDQEGIIGGDIIDAGYTRITARLNTEVVLLKNSERNILTFGENLTYTNTENKAVASEGIYYNDLHNALVATPLMPAYWDNESISAYTNGYAPNLDGIDTDQLNPLAEMYYGRNFSYGKSNSIIGNMYALLEPIKNLKIRSSFGVNAWYGYSRSYTPVYSMGTLLNNTTDAASQSAYMGSDLTWTNTATYDFTINDDHEFTVLAGTEMLKNYFNFNVGGWAQNTLFSDAASAYLDNTTSSTFGDVSTWGADYAAGGGGLMSYMSRLSYNYKGKYMADATFRADGSSNFAEGNRWGYFPSLSAGWNFTQEEFMKDVDFITSGKLRASWGQNGNQNISNFVYTSNVEYLDQGYFFGSDKEVPSIAAVPSNVPNPDVTWEVSEQLNIGTDLRLLNSRMNVTLDWYNKLTKDWLVEAPILGTYGASAPYINGGDVRNRGFEISVGWNDHIGSDFTYGVTFTGAHNKNVVTRIDNAEGIITGSSSVIAQNTSYVSRVEVGMPIGYFYGYQTAGIFQNQAECDAYVSSDGSQIQVITEEGIERQPGDVIFVDQNGDGVINEDDKVMIGDPNADFEAGLQVNLSYKGFYANATLTGKFGQQVMQSYRSFTDQLTENYTTAIFDRWHGEGTSNTTPRLSYTGNANTNLVSDIYVKDADYVRVSSLTVGYNFDNLIKNFDVVKRASIYMSVNNLCTITGYDGMDPEVGYGGGDSWASGIDLGLYSLPRTVIFGINLTF
ncbi:MAG: TonB-dependent receptor [Rikenellaceae bacterium]